MGKSSLIEHKMVSFIIHIIQLHVVISILKQTLIIINSIENNICHPTAKKNKYRNFF